MAQGKIWEASFGPVFGNRLAGGTELVVLDTVVGVDVGVVLLT